MAPPEYRIVPATAADVPLVLGFLRGLAEHEGRPEAVVVDEEGLREALFGRRPCAEVVLAYAEEAPAGFALFFQSYSTFLGERGLYLEDIFVRPEWRGRGIGTQLLIHLARLARARECGRLEFAVLRWNREAIRFYESLGAEVKDQWAHYRLRGEALGRLADGALD